MGHIDDFNKMDISLKGVMLSVALQMPFWFIDLYIFNPALYWKSDYVLMFCFCFCLSIIALIIQLLLYTAFIGDPKKMTRMATKDLGLYAVIMVMFVITFISCAGIDLLLLRYWEHNYIVHLFLMMGLPFVPTYIRKTLIKLFLPKKTKNEKPKE